MTNEAVFLILLCVWVLGGFGLNLCFLILAYYAAYMITEVIHLGLFPDLPASLYYVNLTFIDLAIIASLCILKLKSTAARLLCFGYAVFVASSLVMDCSALLTSINNSDYFRGFYEFRQKFSHAVDLIFALLGSGLNVYLGRASLLIRGRQYYNNDNFDKDS